MTWAYRHQKLLLLAHTGSHLLSFMQVLPIKRACLSAWPNQPVAVAVAVALARLSELVHRVDTAAAAPVERGHAVYYEQCEAGVCHHGGGSQQQLRLVVCVVGPRIGDVVQYV